MTTLLILVIFVGLSVLVYRGLNSTKKAAIKQVTDKVEHAVNTALDTNHDGIVSTKDATVVVKQAQKITAKVGRKPRKPKKNT